MNDLFFDINLPFYKGGKAGSDVGVSNFKSCDSENLINLPFSLYLDRQYLLPRLYLTEEIISAINDSYANSSMISTPLGTSLLSNNRLNEVLNCLKEKAFNEFFGKTFVEIGSGTGHLLFAVKKLGAEVIGFEIGPQAKKYAKEFDVDIINDYFHPSYFDQKVDCIFSSGCLEHIIELKEFMKNSLLVLRQGGLFFASVPNSLEPFERGSVEHLCHEHVNYFTPENSIRFLEQCGYENCGSTTNSVGNEIYLWGYNSSNPIDKTSKKDWSIIVDNELKLLKLYENRLKSNLSQKKIALQRLAAGSDKKIGFYGGGASICYLAGIQEKSRFFDGDDAKWGHKWMPGLSEIEDPRNLLKYGVDNLVICVEHYAPQIVKYLSDQKIISSKMKIHLLSELVIKNN